MMYQEGYRVVESNTLRCGESLVNHYDKVLIVGTRPYTMVEAAGWEARWRVQQGLLDVLKWLGETPMRRRPPGKGRSLIEFLKAQGTASLDFDQWAGRP